MKKFRALLVAFLLPASLVANAQTETVAPEPKKLQQLYLSIGTGPALTSGNDLHTFGGNLELSVTTGFGSDYLLRAGFKRNAFVGSFDPETSIFSYLDLGYHSYFNPSSHINSGQLAIGKRKTINNLLQLQAFGGLSFNQISQPENYPKSAAESYPPIWDLRMVSSYKPGAIFQTEVMFLPTRFSGLTLSAYYHFVPKISNGGLTLSLNLGRIRTKKIL